jgi:SPFH domain / Band 7 family
VPVGRLLFLRRSPRLRQSDFRLGSAICSRSGEKRTHLGHRRREAFASPCRGRRHLQGRRERYRADKRQVSAGAPRRRCAAQVRPQYLETVISPEIGSQAREVISKYTAEEIYTSRNKIQEQIHNATRKSLGANLDKLVQPEATEQPDPKGYNDFLQGSIQNPCSAAEVQQRRHKLGEVGEPETRDAPKGCPSGRAAQLSTVSVRDWLARS